MESPVRHREFSLRQRVQVRLIAWIGWLLVQVLGATVRFHAEDEEFLKGLKEQGRPVIFAFWHNQILLATYYFRFRGIVVMTSQNFDGEYIARIIQWFGYGSARGSSSRGATGALIELKSRLQEGRDVAFTVDGPRGPRYTVKAGPLFLARKTGAPIVPFYIRPARFWTLSSWDEFRIPRPFTSAVIRFGRPLQVPPEAMEAEWLEIFQAEMDRIGGGAVA